jgi:hypothetical protein
MKAHLLSLEEKGDKLFRAGVVAPFPTVLGEIKFTGYHSG